jgi:3-oxoacyl-[acyl-carrier protein] reductase
MMNLSGKTALITGASRGIGRAIALLYAEHGCNIAFTYINEQNEAEKLLKELQSHHVQALCIQSDASLFDAAHAVVKQVVDTFGRLDILICNAGITRDTLLMRMSEEQWDNVINVNLKSVFNYCHAASTQMMRQRSGSIIAMSSIVGVAGNPGQVNYAASKAGIIGLVKSLSKELGSRNIRVNAIAPGYILTDMTLALPDAAREEITKMIPMRRCGDAQEVAKVALFLASDLASYVSGQVLGVNGAMG